MLNSLFNNRMFLPGSGGPPADPDPFRSDIPKSAWAVLATALISMSSVSAQSAAGEFGVDSPGEIEARKAKACMTYQVPQEACKVPQVVALLERILALDSPARQREVRRLYEDSPGEPVYGFLYALSRMEKEVPDIAALEIVNRGLMGRSWMLDNEAVGLWGDRLMNYSDSVSRGKELGLLP